MLGKSITGLLFCVTAALASPSFGQEYYFGGSASAVFPDNYDFNVPGTIELDLDQTIGFTGIVGLQFTPNIRGELELGYFESDASDATFSNGNSVAAQGDVSTTFLMANAWYDFDPTGPVQPYVGGGIGGARVSADWSDTVDAGQFNSENAFAYQFGVGLLYDISDNSYIDIGYRWMRVDGADINYGFDGGPDIGVSSSRYDSHRLQAGFLLKF